MSSCRFFFLYMDVISTCDCIQYVYFSAHLSSVSADLFLAVVRWCQLIRPTDVLIPPPWSPCCVLRYRLPKSWKTEFSDFEWQQHSHYGAPARTPGFPQGGGRKVLRLSYMVLYEFTNKELYKKAASTLLLPGGRTLVSPVGVRHNMRGVVATSSALAGAHTHAYTSASVILKLDFFIPRSCLDERKEAGVS